MLYPEFLMFQEEMEKYTTDMLMESFPFDPKFIYLSFQSPLPPSFKKLSKKIKRKTFLGET